MDLMKKAFFILSIAAFLNVLGGDEAVAGLRGDVDIGIALENVQVPFIQNRGQVDGKVAFYARILGGTLFITRSGEMVLTMSPDTTANCRPDVIREVLIGGSSVKPKGLGVSPTRLSHFIGNDPARWQRDVPTFSSVNLGNVYDGIELRFEAKGGTVEKIFTVQPGSDPSAIRIGVEGIQELRVGEGGSLIARMPEGEVSYTAPVAYQETPNGRESVQVAYMVKGNTYGFEVGTYDKKRPLTIDPILGATYLGGTADDPGWSLAFDSSGNIYIAGRTFSTDFPGVDASSAQETMLGFQDVYVAKFNPGLNVLYHATYLGGTGSEEPGTGDGGGPSIAVHPVTQDVYLTGWTSSSNFPQTANGWQNTKDAGMDAYITILENSLDTIVRSTYFGGGDDDIATALAFHPESGDVCITGRTQSTDLPDVSGGDQTTHGGGTWDGFVACFDQDLTPIRQATYVGGEGNDWPFSITIDDNVLSSNYGSVYVAGYTDSTNFPTAIQNHLVGTGGGSDAFVIIAKGDLTTTLWATFIGGTGEDRAFSVKVHPLTGDVYLGGTTSSSDFPGTHTLVSQPDLGGSSDAFISRLSSGIGTHYEATYYGGTDSEQSAALTIDPVSGSVYLAGSTLSLDLPGVAGGVQETKTDIYNLDVYIASHSASLSTLNQATYMGGSSRDMGYAVGLGPFNGDVYVTGLTWSHDLPGVSTTLSAQPVHGGGNQDGYVVWLDGTLQATVLPDISITPLSIYFGTAEVGSTIPSGILVSNAGGGELSVTGLDLSDITNFDYDIDMDPGGVIPACGDYSTASTLFVLGPADECYVSLYFLPASLGVQTADLVVTSTDGDEAQVTVALEGVGGYDPDISVIPSSHDFGVLAVGDTVSRIFTISNKGASALSVDDIYLTNDIDFHWQVVDCPDTFPFELPVGSSCTVSAIFVPSDYGARLSTLQIESNDPDAGGLTQVSLTGGTNDPDISVSPLSQDIYYAETGTGLGSNLAFYTIVNLGGVGLTVYDISLSEGPTYLFSLEHTGEPGECPATEFGLGPGAMCEFWARYHPSSNELYGPAFSVGIIISSSDPDEATTQVNLIGHGAPGSDEGCCALSNPGRGSSGMGFLPVLLVMGLWMWRRRKLG